eukprot:g1121.t1
MQTVPYQLGSLQGSGCSLDWLNVETSRSMETAADKGQMMRRLLQSSENERCSIFIGDSVLDLKALLLADLGIVIGDNQELRTMLDHCKIKLSSLKSSLLSKSLLYQKPAQYRDSQPILYSVSSWNEIEQFLFEDDQGSSSVPRVMVIAGSDSGGGAGIQADIKTCMATGSFASTIITAVTSQNTHGVQSVHGIPSDHVQSQIESILSDLGADVIKTGMLPSADIVKLIAESLSTVEFRALVVDPVLVSTSGDSLASNEVAQAIIKHLLPICSILTPNIPEAESLLEEPINSVQEMKEAARKLQSMGPKLVLIKGGHLADSGTSVIIDVVYDGSEMLEIRHPMIQTDRLHGTGCTLASAIASYLAQNFTPVKAVHAAIEYLQEALRNSTLMKLGHGKQLPFDHGYFLHHWPVNKNRTLDLSLYAITDRRCNEKHNRELSEAVKQALEGGVSILQVREKNAPSTLEFIQSVHAVMEVAKNFQVPVIVNDRIDVLLATDAHGLHVGQDDLPVDEIRRIIGFHKILGISVKTKDQAIQAEKAGADYLGVGAVFPTDSKDSSVIGIDALNQICRTVKIPVVAIGGISQSNASNVLKTGVSGLALISAIFDQHDITSATRDLKGTIDSTRSV